MVSIVVPVYNAANYIEKTIRMVCDQTYKDWELILVDDASSDNSVQVIEDVISTQKKRIRLIKKDVNAGAAAARNTGIDASSGRFIAFLDADDIYHVGYCRALWVRHFRDGTWQCRYMGVCMHGRRNECRLRLCPLQDIRQELSVRKEKC